MKKRIHLRALFAMLSAAILVGVPFAWAEDDITITEFRNGYITFTNANPNLYYRVEFKPNLTDPVDWDGSFEDLRNIESSDEEVTVPVGVFYRVRGRETPWVVESGGGGGGVPQTGQTESYRTGDDGDWQKGVAWPDPRFTDNEDETVTDNLTGLMWVKAPHSLTGNSGSQSWDDAIDFCNDLTFAEHSDWRLPNRFELESLLDLSQALGPLLPSEHPFTGIQSDFYWSSSTWASNPDWNAWDVGLNDGRVNYFSKSDTSRVWPVRAGQ